MIEVDIGSNSFLTTSSPASLADAFKKKRRTRKNRSSGTLKEVLDNNDAVAETLENDPAKIAARKAENFAKAAEQRRAQKSIKVERTEKTK